jgi:hypothetical protein
LNLVLLELELEVVVLAELDELALLVVEWEEELEALEVVEVTLAVDALALLVPVPT